MSEAESRARAVVVEVVAAAPQDAPGTVALLLDHLERRAIRATWRGPADDALLFRLAFGRHEAWDPESADALDAPAPFAEPVAADPLRWLQAAQLTVGAAVRGDGPRRIVFDVAELDRPDAFSVVAEILDLIEGLRDAGRLRLLTLGELTQR